MNVKFIRAWIAALRSGEYRQSAGAHRQHDGSYCALGCAYALRADQKWTENRMMQMFIAGHGGIVPDEVQADTGLSRSELFRIVDMNDDGQSFAQIADYLEAKLPPDWQVIAASPLLPEHVKSEELA